MTTPLDHARENRKLVKRSAISMLLLTKKTVLNLSTLISIIPGIIAEQVKLSETYFLWSQ